MFYQHLNENLSDTLVDPAGRLKEGEDPMDYVNSQAFEAKEMALHLEPMASLEKRIQNRREQRGIQPDM
jgi:hypothetical protein